MRCDCQFPRPRESVAQIAADVLRETNNPSVGVGDAGLLHMIAERSGIIPQGHSTEKRVLDAIDRTNKGELIKGYTSWPQRGYHTCRRFSLSAATVEGKDT